MKRKLTIRRNGFEKGSARENDPPVLTGKEAPGYSDYAPPRRPPTRPAWGIEAVKPEEKRTKREKPARKKHKLFGNKKIKASKTSQPDHADTEREALNYTL